MSAGRRKPLPERAKKFGKRGRRTEKGQKKELEGEVPSSFCFLGLSKKRQTANAAADSNHGMRKIRMKYQLDPYFGARGKREKSCGENRKKGWRGLEKIGEKNHGFGLKRDVKPAELESGLQVFGKS